MAITIRAAAAAGSTPVATTSITITKPTGTVDGDVMLAFITHQRNVDISGAPSGWAVVDTANSSFSGDSRGVGHTCYVKVAASEGADYTWTWEVANDNAGVIVSYSGVDTSSPVHVHAGNPDDGQNTDLIASSVTTTVADTMLVCGFACSPDSSAAITHSVPATMTFRAEKVSAAGGSQSRAGVSVCDEAIAATGATGTRISVVNDAGQMGNISVALAPASPPGAARNSRLSVEVLDQGTPKTRISRLAVEVLSSEAPLGGLVKKFPTGTATTRTFPGAVARTVKLRTGGVWEPI